MVRSMERGSWRDQIEDDDDDLDDEEDDDLDQDGYPYLSDSLSNTNTAFRNVSGRQPRSEESKRDHHNRLERKRRASIKTCYSSLREVIPTLRGTKASRAVILQKAVDHIDELRGIVHDVGNNIRELRRRDQNIKADLRRREVLLQKKVTEYRDSKQKLQQQMQQQQLLRQQQKQQQQQQQQQQQEQDQIQQNQSPTSDDSQTGTQSTNSQQSTSSQQLKQKQAMPFQQKRKVAVANHNSSVVSPKRQVQQQNISQRPQHLQVLQLSHEQSEQDESPTNHQIPQSSSYAKQEPQSFANQE